MRKPTREELEMTLALLGQARNYVTFIDVTVSDLAEKALDLIALVERKAAEVETEDENAGGSQEQPSLRDTQIEYIRETYRVLAGSLGPWSDDAWVAQLTDEQIQAQYEVAYSLHN